MGELCLSAHTGEPAEDRKAWEGATELKQTCLVSTYPYDPKIKTAYTNKID